MLMAPDSPLHDGSVVFPGILITSVLLAGSLLLTKSGLMEGVNRMKKFSMQLSSDAIRLSKTFFIVHLAIPVLGILVFTVYQSMTIYPPEKENLVNYYQVLTLIYPLLAAWICSILTEQDVESRRRVPPFERPITDEEPAV